MRKMVGWPSTKLPVSSRSTPGGGSQNGGSVASPLLHTKSYAFWSQPTLPGATPKPRSPDVPPPPTTAAAAAAGATALSPPSLVPSGTAAAGFIARPSPTAPPAPPPRAADAFSGGGVAMPAAAAAAAKSCPCSAWWRSD